MLPVCTLRHAPLEGESAKQGRSPLVPSLGTGISSVLRIRACQLRLERLETGLRQPGGGLDDVPGYPNSQEALHDFDLRVLFAFSPALCFAFGQQFLRIRHELLSYVDTVTLHRLLERVDPFAPLRRRQV